MTHKKFKPLILLWIWFGILSTFISCQNKYFNDYIEITVVTEIADCEKWNVFSKIIDINNADYIEFKDEFILIVCDSDRCKKTLYSIKHDDTTRVFKLKGYLSQEVHGVKDYGCPRAHSFKADYVEELETIQKNKAK